jgi:hypothetical protein
MPVREDETAIALGALREDGRAPGEAHPSRRKKGAAKPSRR